METGQFCGEILWATRATSNDLADHWIWAENPGKDVALKMDGFPGKMMIHQWMEWGYQNFQTKK